VKALAVCACLLAAPALAQRPAACAETFALEPFGTLTVYRQTPRPAHVVLFISGDGGWKLGVVDMARELASLDALVVGIDITHYMRTVAGRAGAGAAPSGAPASAASGAAGAAASGSAAGAAPGGATVGAAPGSTAAAAAAAAAGAPGASSPAPPGAAASQPCFDPAKDFAELGRVVEERFGYPDRRPPILVGYSSGATLVYATLVQAPPRTFAGGVSLGFCPDLMVEMPICKGNGLTWQRDPHHKGVDFLPSHLLEVPWVALQGDIDKICTPADTRSYVAKVPHGELVWLHKVGHGFSVTRRWMPQLKASVARVARAAGR